MGWRVGATWLEVTIHFPATTDMSDTSSTGEFEFQQLPWVTETTRKAWELMLAKENQCSSRVSSVTAALSHFTEYLGDLTDGETTLYYLDAPPLNGCVRITAEIKAGECPKLRVHDLFITPQGDATRLRVLEDVKKFVRESPLMVWVWIYANTSFVAMDAYGGSCCFSSFERLASRVGFQAGYSFTCGAVVYYRNDGKRCAEAAAQEMSKKGLPVELQSHILSYVKCVYEWHARKTVLARRASKRAREGRRGGALKPNNFFLAHGRFKMPLQRFDVTNTPFRRLDVLKRLVTAACLDWPGAPLNSRKFCNFLENGVEGGGWAPRLTIQLSTNKTETMAPTKPVRLSRCERELKKLSIGLPGCKTIVPRAGVHAEGDEACACRGE